MRKAISKFILLIMVFLTVFLFINANYSQNEQEKREPELESVHEHDENGHDHEYHGDLNTLDMSIDEILDLECEHNIKSIDCGHCRFEVGAVNIDPSLLGADGSDGLVKISKVGLKKPSINLKTTGEIKLNRSRTVQVSSRISGVVREVIVDYGTKVEKGDPLLTIDSIELGEATADYLKAKAIMELSRQSYEREKVLYDQKISSEKEMLQAKTEYKSNVITLEAMKRKLCLLGLSNGDIEKLSNPGSFDIGSTSVKAPISGYVTELQVAVGSYITNQDELLSVSDLNSLWVWADVYEPYLLSLLRASSNSSIRAWLSVDAYSEHRFDGKVDYIGNIMQESTRTIRVRITVKNHEGLLRPGMFCHITIPLPTHDKSLLVPTEAVLSDEGASFVFKQLKDNLFIRRRVTVGQIFDSGVEILDGVAIGEQVVTAGAFILKSDVLRTKMGAGCAE